MAGHTSSAAISFEHGCSWSSEDGGGLSWIGSHLLFDSKCFFVV